MDHGWPGLVSAGKPKRQQSKMSPQPPSLFIVVEKRRFHSPAFFKTHIIEMYMLCPLFFFFLFSSSSIFIFQAFFSPFVVYDNTLKQLTLISSFFRLF
jgi:hypothetical protein